MILKNKFFWIIIFASILSGCSQDSFDETKNFYTKNQKLLEESKTKIEEKKIDISFLNLDKNILHRLTRPESWLNLNCNFLVVLKNDSSEYSFYYNNDDKDFDIDTLSIRNTFKTSLSDIKEFGSIVTRLDCNYFHTASGNFILIDQLEYYEFSSTPDYMIRIDSNWYYEKYNGL